jgi:hypothetical protein
MTQDASPVGGEPAPVEPTENPADAFTKLAEEEFGVTDEEEDQAPAEDEADDDLELEEGAGEPTPIEAPVSWDAEAKERFAKLPREDQEYLSKREGERERYVHTTKAEAVKARQDSERAASEQLAQIEAGYAQQWAQAAQSIAPQRPDATLLATNPYEYAAQQQRYDESMAQREHAQHMAQQYAVAAQQRGQAAEQAQLAEQHQIIAEHFPEYADPTTGPKLRTELSAVAKELGYPEELISQARATDILAMRKVSELKVKADKYDALISKQMSKVRAAKGLPRVATPGVSQGNDQLRARTAQAAIETAKSSKNRDVQGQAFYDYLTKTGQLK